MIDKVNFASCIQEMALLLGVEASGEWEYGYLNVGGKKWLNFESGKYEKGKNLCRLKDVKKRGGPYKSGMDVCCIGLCIC